ncbi:MAG: putative beta-lysine N-acetyltransferase [Mangrovibacterium sp.]
MDRIDYIGKSCIQHGKDNNRIYLLKYREEDGNGLLPRLDEMACENGYGKIIAKVPASAQPLFLQNGYQPEAYIPGFFDGVEGMFFMAKYTDTGRMTIPTEALSVLAGLLSSPNGNGVSKANKLSTGILNPEQTGEMAALYRRVFKTYPFPITDAAYLKQTMTEETVIYYGVWDGARLIGLSSAELDRDARNAEMTDFAVLPEYRGQNLAGLLLEAMEEDMAKLSFKTLYTIARLNNPGMNKTFIKQGYHYSGLLKNNTNISGQIESMTVFYKNLML